MSRIGKKPIPLPKNVTVEATDEGVRVKGPKGEIRRPMAITVIAGTLVATFLTLVVIPVLYSVLDRKAFVKTAAGNVENAKPSAPPLAVLSKRED